tara:strand:+ start:419 stop:934 length:516 start_codon:yes stop_codon:yes gene_type:complete
MSGSFFNLPDDLKSARFITIDNADNNINQILSDVFIPPNLSNCIMFKKTWFKKMLKQYKKEEKNRPDFKKKNTKEQTFEFLMNLVIQSVYIKNLFETDLIFWYFDCDDKSYDKELYFECYGFNLADINSLKEEANIPQMIFDLYEKEKENIHNKKIIFAFNQCERAFLEYT